MELDNSSCPYFGSLVDYGVSKFRRSHLPKVSREYSIEERAKSCNILTFRLSVKKIVKGVLFLLLASRLPYKRAYLRVSQV